MNNYLTIPTPDGLMEVYTSASEGDGLLPVVILIQEAFGVNAHIKDVAHRLAKEGFLVLAPELYHRLEKHLQIPYSDRQAFMPIMGTLTNEGMICDLKAVLDFLPQHPRAAFDQVYTLGFCVGGFASMLAATELPIQGAIAYYGAGMVRAREGLKLSPIVGQFPNINCPVLLFFGTDDASIPENDLVEIKKSLTRNTIEHDLIIYPESDHGFFCNERKTYNHSAASKSWQKTITWLQERKPNYAENNIT